MANNDMTWERWQSLTPEQKEWEHFSYHERTNKKFTEIYESVDGRLIKLESGKLRRGLTQFFGSFCGGASAVAGFLILCKDLLT